MIIIMTVYCNDNYTVPSPKRAHYGMLPHPLILAQFPAEVLKHTLMSTHPELLAHLRESLIVALKLIVKNASWARHNLQTK